MRQADGLPSLPRAADHRIIKGMAYAAEADGTWEHLVARRWELYRSAAPLFEYYGFRGVTVDALARACLLSPASLYHYFPSKLSLALFPFSHANGLCREWQRRLQAMPNDPLVRLHGVLDFLTDVSDDVRLAVRLSREIGGDERYARDVARSMAEARADFSMIARSIDPAVTDERSSDLFAGLVAVIVGAVPGTYGNAAGLRRRLGDVARGWVASLGVPSSDFDAAEPVAMAFG